MTRPALVAAWAAAHPILYEIVVVVLLLGGAWLAARLLSAVLERVLTRATAVDPPSVERRLATALRRPLTALLFLFGVWAAVHRAPLPLSWMVRFDRVLFTIGVVLSAVALLRSWTVGLEWYVRDTALGRGDRLASNFGPLFNKVGRVFIALVAFITLLQHLGVDVASLVVSLGVGSLAIGLAAQDTLANMFAGFTLLMDRPFRVGDRIQLSTGEAGDVLSIGMRATHIRTYDATVLVVPNSVLVKDRLVNLSEPARSIVTRVELTLAWTTDMETARGVLLGAASASGRVATDPPPLVVLTRFSELGIHATLVFHVSDYTELGLARSEVQEAAWRGLRAAGIEMASLRYDAATARRGGGGA